MTEIPPTTEQFTYQGHHRIWHVLPGDGTVGRAKFSEPREGALWFDRRCFDTEEPLLAELATLGVRGIPSVRGENLYGENLRGENLRQENPRGGERELLVQEFIEGRSLAELAPPRTPVPAVHLDQIIGRFRQLATVRPEQVRTPRRCRPEHHSTPGDTAGFLRTLIGFSHQRRYQDQPDRHRALFAALRVPTGVLAPGSWLDNEAKALTSRPFCLLHGDLHRANFIVDPADVLWTIDWELAMLGDPLYDLATHLHLMDYPAAQRDRVIARWRAAVSGVLPGADAGIEDDLPRYLAYKRVQSVFTDVVRHAQKHTPAEPGRQLPEPGGSPARGETTGLLRDTGRTLHRVIRRAAEVLGLDRVPSPRAIERVYAALTP